MAFNIFKWLFGDTEDENKKVGARVAVNSNDFLEEGSSSQVGALGVYIQRMAFWAIVRKIGNALGMVEWETYRRGKKVKAREYWSWNYSPNPNQTRQEFMLRLVGQLYSQQEALIVEHSGYRYVADSYTTEKHLTGDIYRDVTVGDDGIPGEFSASAVMHLKIEGARIKQILNAITAAEGKLLKTSANAYTRNAGRHGILHVQEIAEADPDFENTYEDLINEKFKKYFTAENAVLPLFNGYEYDENGRTGYTSVKPTRDIRALLDDIIELTSQALGIPSSIGTGKNVTDADFQAFMTSTVQPLVKQIETEMNRKVYGQSLVYAGSYIVADLGGIRYTDIFDVANPIDKLIGSGAFCVNDIRVRLGLDIIDAPWAWQHWMTKNYSSVEDLLTCVDQEDTDGDVDKNAPVSPEEKEVNNG